MFSDGQPQAGVVDLRRRGAQARPEVAATEHLQLIQAGVGNPHGHPLRTQRPFEQAQVHTGEGGLIIMEDVAIVALAVHPGVAKLGADALDPRERLAQRQGVPIAGT
ncbi:MAG: hypothetical protein ACK56I_13720, partial [bacterium]